MTTVYADAEGNILGISEGTDEKNIGFFYYNYTFDVRPDALKDYTLHYLGRTSSALAGKWVVSANTGDTSGQIRAVTTDAVIDGHTFEHITLSPLGLSAKGTFSGESAVEFEAIVETAGGEVYIGTGSGGWENDTHTFSYDWRSPKPLDVSSVTGVTINGVEINLD
jgi:hypothetical protein